MDVLSRPTATAVTAMFDGAVEADAPLSARLLTLSPWCPGC